MIDMDQHVCHRCRFTSRMSLVTDRNLSFRFVYQLGDLASFIVDREIEILDGLHTLLAESCAQLIKAYSALLELDW